MSFKEKALSEDVEAAVTSPNNGTIQKEGIPKVVAQVRPLSTKAKLSAYFTIAAAAFGLIRSVFSVN